MLVDLQFLHQPEVAVQPPPVEPGLVAQRRGHFTARPGLGAQAHAGSVGLQRPAARQLLLAEHRELRIELVIGAHNEAVRKGDAPAIGMAAHIELGAGAQGQPFVEHFIADAGDELAHAGVLAFGVGFAGGAQPGAGGEAVIFPLAARFQHFTPGVRHQVRLAVGLGLQLHRFGQLQPGVSAYLARARF